MVVRWSVQVPDTGTLGYRLAALSQMKERTASRPVSHLVGIDGEI
jgi:hypothetical protein